MRLKLKLIPLKIIICIAFFISCTENLNFDEINLNLDPIITVPLINFELDQDDFFNSSSGTEIPTITDISDFRVFGSSDIRNEIIKTVFDFEIENRFDRSFEVNVVFFDGNDNITQIIPALNIVSEDLDYVATYSVEIANSPTFLSSRKVSVEVKLIPSSSQIDPNIYQTIKFRSTGTFHFSI